MQINNLENKIKNLISKTHPELSLSEVIKMSLGISTNVYRLSTSDGIYYFRIPKNINENISGEVLILQRLQEKGMKVPKVIGHENFCHELDGYSYYITSEIKGTPIDNTNRDTVLHDAGSQLALLNSIEYPGFGGITRYQENIESVSGHLNSYSDFILYKWESHLNKLQNKGILSDNKIVSITKLLRDNHDFFNQLQGYLMHGDLNVNHIYSHKGNFSGFIDFSDCRIANKFFDLAYFKICNREDFASLVNGYAKVNPQILNEINGLDFLITTLIVGIRIVSSLIDNEQDLVKVSQVRSLILELDSI